MWRDDRDSHGPQRLCRIWQEANSYFYRIPYLALFARSLVYPLPIILPNAQIVCPERKQWDRRAGYASLLEIFWKLCNQPLMNKTEETGETEIYT